MKFLLVFCLLQQYLMLPMAVAANKPRVVEYPSEAIAQYATEFINDSKTVGEVMRMMASHISEEELKNTEALYKKLEIDAKVQFPKLRQEGNKIYFDKNNYIQLQDSQTIIINGFVFKQNKKSLNANMEDIFKTINTKNVSSLFIPSAHAIAPLLLGLLAFGGGMMLASVVGPMLSGNNAGSEAMAGIGGAALGVGGTLAFMNLFRQREHIYCHGGGYYLRPPGAYPPGNVIHPYMMTQTFGPRYPACTTPRPFATSLASWQQPPPRPQPNNRRLPGTPMQMTPVGS